MTGVYEKHRGFKSPATTRPRRPGAGGQRASPCPTPSLPFVSHSAARSTADRFGVINVVGGWSPPRGANQRHDLSIFDPDWPISAESGAPMTSQRMAQISREEAFPLKGPRRWTSIRPTSTGMRGTTMAKRGMRRWVTFAAWTRKVCPHVPSVCAITTRRALGHGARPMQQKDRRYQTWRRRRARPAHQRRSAAKGAPGTGLSRYLGTEMYRADAANLPG